MDEVIDTYASADGQQIEYYRWSGEDQPKGVVQLAHGMGEHAARYKRLATALVDAGYVVYANDHRGHGRTAGGPELHGNLGASGFPGLIDDMWALTEIARAAEPDVPLIVVGHSLGSIALQRYLLDHSAGIDGAVLSGTTAVDIVAAGMDTTQPADLTAFNAPFAPARTDFDWLSRDNDEVDAYINDPACGFGVDAEGLGGMMGVAAEVSDPARLAGIRSDLPIYLFSGDADPLAGGGPLVELVADRYRQAGVNDVTVHLYPGARHETLNETNRDEVTSDLLAWLDRVTAG